ncbi:MAG: hypothetical protein JXA10_09870 [Anaerolineae bacterium]|nr:hypothetical protein [Anaerolineae bacterium]
MTSERNLSFNAIDLITRQTLERWDVVLSALKTARDAFEKQWSLSRSEMLTRDLQTDILAVMKTLVRDPGEDDEADLAAATERARAARERVQADLGDHALEVFEQMLDQLEAEIMLRQEAINYRRAAWRLEERYALWHKAQQSLENIPYLYFPTKSDQRDWLVQDSLPGRMYADRLIVELQTALADEQPAEQIEDIYYLALALSSEAVHGWLRAKLAPVGDIVRFVRHRSDDLPLNIALPRALQLRDELQTSHWNAPFLIAQLNDIARSAIDRAHQDIAQAVKTKRIADIRDVYPVVNVVDVLWDEIKRTLAGVNDDMAIQDIRRLIEEYNGLYQHFLDWRALALDNQIENPEKHSILEQPLPIFTAIIDLIRQSNDIGWDMSDILGDEQAIRSLVDNLQRMAQQIVDQNEETQKSMREQAKTHITTIQTLTDRLDELAKAQSEMPVLPPPPDSAAINRAIRDANQAILDEMAVLRREFITQQNTLKTDLDTQTSALATRVNNQINEYQTGLNNNLAMFQRQFSALINAEVALLCYFVDSVYTEVQKDTERLELIDDLLRLVSSCSVAAFGKVFPDWNRALMYHVKRLNVYQRVMKKREPLPKFGEELAALADNNEGNLSVINYWYQVACKKAQQSDRIMGRAANPVETSDEDTNDSRSVTHGE